MTRASVLCVNYHSEEDILALAHRLHARYASELEVIVVDNSSSFPSCSDSLGDFIRVVSSRGGNIGFGRGINLAASRAKSPMLFVVNPDVEIGDMQLFERWMDRLSKAPAHIGAVGCRVFNPDGSPQAVAITNLMPSAGSFLLRTMFVALPSFLKQIRRSENPAQVLGEASQEPLPVIGFYAAFVLFRSEAFLSIGGFDPDFFMYCEDTELFRRRFSKIWTCWIYLDLSIVHKARQSDVHKVMDAQQIVSYLLYLRKFLAAHLFSFLEIYLPWAFFCLRWVGTRPRHGGYFGRCATSRT